jgi:hypothetical protein
MIEDNNDFESYYEPPSKPRRGNGADAADEPLPKLIPIRTSELMGAPVPTREWRVRGWIPLDTTTLIQGDGGLGKTSLAQQLQTSCATELPWIGLPVEPCVSLGVYTEDKLRDLEIRQAAINAVYGCDYDQTSHMLWLPRAGEESELIVFDRVGTPTLTKFYWQVCEAALDYQAGLVTLDVAVDLYGGDEIKRRQVRAFIRSLNNLAERIRGSVVLTGHVSQSGIQSDGGHSGSTDWSAPPSNIHIPNVYTGGQSSEYPSPTEKSASTKGLSPVIQPAPLGRPSYDQDQLFHPRSWDSDQFKSPLLYHHDFSDHSVSTTHHTNVTVNGVSDPKEAADAVASSLHDVFGKPQSITRNLQGMMT